MNQQFKGSAVDPRMPVHAPGHAVDHRATFITKTYMHLFGAIVAFVALETALFMSPIPELITPYMFGGGMSWLVVLLAFAGVSWVANSWAHRSTSLPMQYAGLALYVVAEAIIFVPLIMMALAMGYEGGDTFGILKTAAWITLALFGALTGVVFVTRKNFSFLRSGLMFAGIAAVGLIVLSLIFGFQLGIYFSYAMVVFSGAIVLYNTSRVLHDYGPGQHVAASLSLFASIALMLWYVMQILMNRR